MALMAVPPLLPRAQPRRFASGGGSRPRQRPGGSWRRLGGTAEAQTEPPETAAAWRGPRGRLAQAEGRGREEMEERRRERGKRQAGPHLPHCGPIAGSHGNAAPAAAHARPPAPLPPEGACAAGRREPWRRACGRSGCAGAEARRSSVWRPGACAGSCGRAAGCCRCGPGAAARGRRGGPGGRSPGRGSGGQVPLAGSRLCLYEDGTELTESYFRVLPPQTELVLLGPGESWRGCASDIEQFLAAFSSQRDAMVEAARQLLSDEGAPRRQKLLADLIHNLSENILAEERADDEKWFEGLESRFKNKSSYMRYSCESRIRSYMKEVSSFISNVHPTARDAYKGIIDLMSDKLKSVKYNGCYFDRREEEAARLCTTEGWFSCQGPFDRDDCPCKHSINPYSNRESRILFSTWNLDHIFALYGNSPPPLTLSFVETPLWQKPIFRHCVLVKQTECA
ncbi:DNA fragmentation factor subunit beta isoform 2-T2 [Alca torda]